jgi:hypothetical protein
MRGDAHPAKLALRDRRERTIARLTESFARDEIGIEAFEARIDTAYRCQTDEEFEALVADLRIDESSEGVEMILAKAELIQGAHGLRPLPGSLVRDEPRPLLRALFSNIERCDRVVMAETIRVEAIFGNVELDLRETHFAFGVTELRVKAIFGSIEIVVPADIAVEVYGAGLFGNFEGATRATADPDAPTLRVVGSAVFASVVVRTVPPLRVQKLAAELRARRLLPP